MQQKCSDRVILVIKQIIELLNGQVLNQQNGRFSTALHCRDEHANMRRITGNWRNQQFPIVTLEAHTNLSISMRRVFGDEYITYVAERERDEQPNLFFTTIRPTLSRVPPSSSTKNNSSPSSTNLSRANAPAGNNQMKQAPYHIFY